MTKLCQTCGEVKPRGEFYAHPKTADGLLGKCKACQRAAMKKNRAESERARIYDRVRAKLPHRRRHAREVVIRWREEHPEAYRAQTAVGNAIRDGKLVKAARCGAEGCERRDVHAHHHDYAKPLDVKWLCPLHHHRLHAEAA